MSLPSRGDPALGALPLAAGKPAATVEEALMTRRSLRAFRPDPVSRKQVEEILALASRAPSGTNIQPWKVRVLAGAERDRLAEAMVKAYFASSGEDFKYDYNYYPVKWREPYLARRRKVGWDLYGLLGITRDDKKGMAQQHARNYQFFGAPVAMIFTIDADMEQGSWLDYGMFLENIMIAARGKGLDTCPQAAIAAAHKVVRGVLAIPESEKIVCGMSLGYADPDAIENSLVTVREPVSAFAHFKGFD